MRPLVGVARYPRVASRREAGLRRKCRSDRSPRRLVTARQATLSVSISRVASALIVARSAEVSAGYLRPVTALRDLERHLVERIRHGARHDVWRSTEAERPVTVPR